MSGLQSEERVFIEAEQLYKKKSTMAAELLPIEKAKGALSSTHYNQKRGGFLDDLEPLNKVPKQLTCDTVTSQLQKFTQQQLANQQ